MSYCVTYSHCVMFSLTLCTFWDTFRKQKSLIYKLMEFENFKAQYLKTAENADKTLQFISCPSKHFCFWRFFSCLLFPGLFECLTFYIPKQT